MTVRATADAVAVGLLAAMTRMYMIKKFVAWPFFPAAGVYYLY